MVLKAAYVKLHVPNTVVLWREMLVPSVIQLGGGGGGGGGLH